jgi:hypothetical protein
MVRINTVLTAIVFLSSSCFGVSPADGRATIPEGMQLETALASGEISLENGVNLRLSPGSAGKVFRDHVVVEQGSIRIGHFNGYTVEAGQLHIEAADSRAQAVVRMTNNVVEVASVGGGLSVTDGGAMLTRVVSGTRLSFQQSAAKGQSGAAPPRKKLPSDRRIMIWTIAVTGVAALTIGLTAAAQGKSPF